MLSLQNGRRVHSLFIENVDHVGNKTCQGQPLRKNAKVPRAYVILRYEGPVYSGNDLTQARMIPPLELPSTDQLLASMLPSKHVMLAGKQGCQVCERDVQGRDGAPVHVEALLGASARQYLVPVRDVHDDRLRDGELTSDLPRAPPNHSTL